MPNSTAAVNANRPPRTAGQRGGNRFVDNELLTCRRRESLAQDPGRMAAVWKLYGETHRLQLGRTRPVKIGAICHHPPRRLALTAESPRRIVARVARRQSARTALLPPSCQRAGQGRASQTDLLMTCRAGQYEPVRNDAEQLRANEAPSIGAYASLCAAAGAAGTPPEAPALTGAARLSSRRPSAPQSAASPPHRCPRSP